MDRDSVDVILTQLQRGLLAFAAALSPYHLLLDLCQGASGSPVADRLPDVGPAWQALGGDWRVVDNQIVRVDSGAELLGAITVPAAANVVFTAEFTTPAGAFNGGLLFNYQDAGNFWIVDIATNGNCDLYEWLNGVGTLRGSASSVFTASTDHRVTVVAQGDTVTVLVDDAEVVSYNAAVRPHQDAGIIGIRAYTAGPESVRYHRLSAVPA